MFAPFRCSLIRNSTKKTWAKGPEAKPQKLLSGLHVGPISREKRCKNAKQNISTFFEQAWIFS